MSQQPHLPEIDPGIPNHAVSVYEDAPDEFPVLKAFQRYIDAEQEKSRKRMLSLSIFFGCLMTVVIAFFIFMLNSISERNQALNDRLIEYAIKDRDRQAAVVVQSPADNNSAILALTAKLDEMQKKFHDAQQQASDAARQRAEAEAAAAAQAAKDQQTAALELEKIRTKEALEVERLKALLAAEREKAAAEREKKRELELEAYRRAHYPEFYAKKEQPVAPAKPKKIDIPEKDPIDEVLEELSADGAISYFDDEDEEEEPQVKPKKDYAIPVEVKGTRGKWRIPTE